MSSFTPPGGIAGWLASFAFLLWIVKLVWSLVDRAQQKPHPKDVQLQSVETFATKSEVEKHVNVLTAEDKALHSRIGAVDRDAQARLSAAIAAISLQLSAMPGKIVADILNAKKLFDRGDHD